jgi:hypothetical protein
MLWVCMDCLGSEENQTILQIHVSRLQTTGSETVSTGAQESSCCQVPLFRS